MDISPNRREQKSSILLKGLGGGLAQRDDLKTWQVWQESLLIQSSPSKSPATTRDEQPTCLNAHNEQGSTFGANFISLLMQTRSFALEDRVKSNENAELEDDRSVVKYPGPTDTNGLHHDLSIIPEVDEDTRTTSNLTETNDEETTPKSSPRVETIPKLALSIPPLKVVPSNQTKFEMQRAPSYPTPTENRFQINSIPAEKKHPTKPFLRRGQGLVRFNLRPEDALKPYQNEGKNLARITKPPPKSLARSSFKKQPEDCPIALSSLKLKKDQPKTSQHVASERANTKGFSTWSHFLAQDPEKENAKDEQNITAGFAGVHRMQENMGRQNILGSPKRIGTLRAGRRIPVDDEESLAAYVALEQHVGDTSFCSTSSKVDRLVAKSSQLPLSESPPHRNRLLQTHAEEQKSDKTAEQAQKTTRPENCMNHVQHNGERDESLFGDWEAEEEELKRKKMSHFTTGGINVIQVDDDESLSESDSESDDESESSEEEEAMFSMIPRNPVKVADFAPANNPCDTSTASIDVVIENINRKVEEHLSRLCVEIETLQKSNASAKNQAKSLKKKVRKLEQKLATEHLAYERKLAEQREDSAKAVAEEKAKVAKEKANLERFCREQKKKEKKEPNPVLIEQVERLRSDMVAKEEKWRAERAKARGIECNLRIQITNLRQENEKLKAENSKLKREKETALNAAKAKNVSNTKVINAIAQHLSKATPQVTVTKETNAPSGKLPVSQDQPTSKRNKTSAQAKAPVTKKDEVSASRQPTIGIFPTSGLTPSNEEWLSSDEDIDLGPETPEKFEEELTKAMSNGAVGSLEDCISATTDSPTESAIAETEARYNALFDTDVQDYQPLKKINSNSGNDVIVHPDGSVERKKSGGGSVLTLPDGTQKRQGKNGSVMTVPPSGWPILVTYYNGDKLERHEDGTVQYFYAKTQTWQITHPDGREELRLPNGVVSDKRGNGSVAAAIPTEATKPANPATTRGGLKEAASAGETVVILPNGEQEIRTKDYVKRKFQDGTVRFLYNDGMQKTIYTSGRIRVKDKDGKLLMDTAATEKR